MIVFFFSVRKLTSTHWRLCTRKHKFHGEWACNSFREFQMQSHYVVCSRSHSKLLIKGTPNQRICNREFDYKIIQMPMTILMKWTRSTNQCQLYRFITEHTRNCVDRNEIMNPLKEHTENVEYKTDTVLVVVQKCMHVNGDRPSRYSSHSSFISQIILNYLFSVFIRSLRISSEFVAIFMLTLSHTFVIRSLSFASVPLWWKRWCNENEHGKIANQFILFDRSDFAFMRFVSIFRCKLPRNSDIQIYEYTQHQQYVQNKQYNTNDVLHLAYSQRELHEREVNTNSKSFV